MTYRAYKASKSPLIERSDGTTHFDLTRFLMFRMSFHANKYMTTYYEASRLANWLNFLTQNNVELYAADTSMIVQFRDEMLAKGKEPVYANLHIMSICGFYWWAQKEKIVSNMIGWLDIDHPERHYLIRVHKAKGNSSSEFSIPYLKKVPSSHQQPIPSREDIEFLEEAIYESHYSDVQYHPLTELAFARDMLIFRWLTEVSLRRNELVSLDISDIQNAKKSDNVFSEMLIYKGTKYDKKRIVLIRNSLLQATLDYIKFERAEILSAKRNVFGKPESVEALFVNTGNSAKHARMNAVTVYKFLNRVEKNKGIKVNPHALRRYSLTELACDLYRVMMNDKDAKSGDAFQVAQANTLYMLAKHAGHNSSDTTIRSYVNIAQTRYMLDE